MKLTRADFDWAASKGLITGEQASSLWTAFGERTAGTAKFDFAHLAYYAGAVMVIIAMGWFLVRNWSDFGPGGVLGISAIYGICFWLTGLHLWKKEESKIPGGLLATLAVCTVPLMTYATMGLLNLWPNGREWWEWNSAYSHINWMVIHFSTVAAGLLALRFVRFPFLVAPISWSLWLIAMDAAPDDGWQSRYSTSALYGFTMLLVAYGIDLRRIQHRDFAFWLYLFGSLTLFVGLNFATKTELGEFVSALGYICMMLTSILLQRKALMVFGALGFIAYLFHLSWSVFHNSAMFPLVLTAMGVAIIGLGLVLQKYRKQLTSTIFGAIPPGMREFLPER